MSADAEGPVLPDGREESVLAGHHAADTRRALQQPRDHPDVPLAQPHHRATARDRLPVRRLRHEAELRLAEALEVATERLPGARQSGVHGRQPGVHGTVEHRPDHDDVRAAPGDEEVGAGREGVQGSSCSVFRGHYLKIQPNTIL